MKLGTKIFCTTLALISLSLYYPVNQFIGTLRTRYLEGIEDSLVDQAYILAALAQEQMQEKGAFSPSWHLWFDQVYQTDLFCHKRSYICGKRCCRAQVFTNPMAVLFFSFFKTILHQGKHTMGIEDRIASFSPAFKSFFNIIHVCIAYVFEHAHGQGRSASCPAVDIDLLARVD